MTPICISTVIFPFDSVSVSFPRCTRRCRRDPDPALRPPEGGRRGQARNAGASRPPGTRPARLPGPESRAAGQPRRADRGDVATAPARRPRGGAADPALTPAQRARNAGPRRPRRGRAAPARRTPGSTSRPPSTRSRPPKPRCGRRRVEGRLGTRPHRAQHLRPALPRRLRAAWVEEVRRELAELQSRARESIARAGIGLGGSELAGAERSARELVRTAPFRESGYVLLMRALVASGNTAEALRTYERLRNLLAEELGTAPGAEIQALHRRLLTGREAEDDPARDPDRRRSGRDQRTDSGRTRPSAPHLAGPAPAQPLRRAHRRARAARGALGRGSDQASPGSSSSAATPAWARPGWRPSSPSGFTTLRAPAFSTGGPTSTARSAISPSSRRCATGRSTPRRRSSEQPRAGMRGSSPGWFPRSRFAFPSRPGRAGRAGAGPPVRRRHRDPLGDRLVPSDAAGDRRPALGRLRRRC